MVSYTHFHMLNLCMAINVCKMNGESIYYAVPSSLPRNVVAITLTSRSVRVSWEPPLVEQQNGVIQYYLVMVMVQQTRASFSLNSSSTSRIIPNLHPAYVYSIEVAAVTIGVGPYSSIISISTPDDGKYSAIFLLESNSSSEYSELTYIIIPCSFG